QKDQKITQQTKLTEDSLARARQKEEVLTRRLEQLQQDWRSALTKLEHAERELMQYRRGTRVADPGTEPPARRSRFDAAAPSRRASSESGASSRSKAVRAKSETKMVTDELPGVAQWVEQESASAPLDEEPMLPLTETAEGEADTDREPKADPPESPPAKPRRVVTREEVQRGLRTTTKPQIRLQ
ncbi:MAG: hypothetical protein KDL10_01620, partial [Kiritimatiellae bacterium]|nr:hypothetical protein [Kiritimatiellia bacterium]